MNIYPHSWWYPPSQRLEVQYWEYHFVGPSWGIPDDGADRREPLELPLEWTAGMNQQSCSRYT